MFQQINCREIKDYVTICTNKLIISLPVLYRVIGFFWSLFQQDDESIMT